MKLGILLSLILSTTVAWATPTPEQPDRNITEYLLVDGSIGLQGFDPVSYFSEGGASPQEGNSAISSMYGGVVYLFASESNKAMFEQDPLKYEPTYGGWCAWAMANDAYAPIDPSLYTLTKEVNGQKVIVDPSDSSARRLHMFLSRGTKARFDADLQNREEAADNFWLNSEDKAGELPRL